MINASDAPAYTHEYDVGTTPCMVVSTAVAELEDCSPVELTPLAEAIDPEALDDLFEPDSTAKRLAFEYNGYDVEVTPDEVQVRKLSD